MAIVHGQIESLKRIKETLHSQGLYRFSSILEIKAFLTHFDKEKKAIIENAENQFDKLTSRHQEVWTKLKKEFEEKKFLKSQNLDSEIRGLEAQYVDLKSKKPSHFIQLLATRLKLRYVASRINQIRSNYSKSLRNHLKSIQMKIDNEEAEILKLNLSRDKMIAGEIQIKSAELDRTKRIVDDLENLIAGAIGENKVVKTLADLPEQFQVINDFQLTFEPPIFNKREMEKIRSIQIDHLVIGPSGIFIIETKNWSKHSIQRLDMRSPIQQIRRSSYALYTFLNSKKSNLVISHHWGEREIPVKNVIAMINNKPEEKFRHVQIKKLSELNAYISHYKYVFNNEEVHRLSTHLLRVNRSSE